MLSELCANQSFDGSASKLRCVVTAAHDDLAPPRPSPPAPDAASEAAARLRLLPRVAWCITGALRSFYLPLVHRSLLTNAIRAVGGRPLLFFSASASDDAKQGRTPLHGPSTCAQRYANLSEFLASHSDWAALTASVSETWRARPAHFTKDASRSVRCCPLPNEVLEVFANPMYAAQIARWHDALQAVVRHEDKHQIKFDWVGKLRFDVVVAMPLPPLAAAAVTSTASAAYMAWPVAMRTHTRAMPMPDHLWLVPREQASDVFGASARYRECVAACEPAQPTERTRALEAVSVGVAAATAMEAARSGARPLGRLRARTQISLSWRANWPTAVTAEARARSWFGRWPHANVWSLNGTLGGMIRDAATYRACERVGLCTAVGKPLMCCGKGPTGLLVRAVQNARVPLGRIILLELPVFIVSDRKFAATLGCAHVASSFRGYFANGRSSCDDLCLRDCAAIAGACDHRASIDLKR